MQGPQGLIRIHDETIYFLCQGFIMKIPFWGQPPDQNCYDDSLYWEVRNPISHKYYIHPLTINRYKWYNCSTLVFGCFGVFNHITRVVLGRYDICLAHYCKLIKPDLRLSLLQCGRLQENHLDGVFSRFPMKRKGTRRASLMPIIRRTKQKSKHVMSIKLERIKDNSSTKTLSMISIDQFLLFLPGRSA